VLESVRNLLQNPYLIPKVRWAVSMRFVTAVFTCHSESRESKMLLLCLCTTCRWWHHCNWISGKCCWVSSVTCVKASLSAL